MAKAMRAKCETIDVVVANNKGTPVWSNYSAGFGAVACIGVTAHVNPHETK
jgi:phosphomannomutase